MYLRQRIKLELLCPIAVARYDIIKAGEYQPAYTIDADRASGLAKCQACGNELFDHPQHPFIDNCTIIIRCDGEFLKL